MNSNDLEKEYKKHNEKWAQDMKILKDMLIQEMNNTPVKVVRNSILEPTSRKIKSWSYSEI